MSKLFSKYFSSSVSNWLFDLFFTYFKNSFSLSSTRQNLSVCFMSVSFWTFSSRRSDEAVTWNTDRAAGGGGPVYLQHLQHPVDCYGVAAEQQTGPHHLQGFWSPALHQPQCDGRENDGLKGRQLGVRPEEHREAQPGTSDLWTPGHWEENCTLACTRSVCPYVSIC